MPQTKLFSFDELSEQSKENAVKFYNECCEEEDDFTPLTVHEVERNRLKHFNFLENWFNKNGDMID